MSDLIEVIQRPQTIVVTLNRGEKGDPGTPGGIQTPTIPPLIAAQTLSALRIVANTGTQYDYANPLNLQSAWSIAGLTTTAVTNGQPCAPIRNQSITDSSWNWSRGSPVFLGINGTLTQTPPSSGYLVSVAKVLSPQTLFIEIEEPIAL